jgi:hypothetical protein
VTEKQQGTITPFETEENNEPSGHTQPGSWLRSPSGDQGFYFTTQPSLGERFLDLLESSFRSIWTAATKSKDPLSKV